MKVHVAFVILVQVTVLKAAAIQENKVEEEVPDAKKCPPWDKWQASKCLWPSQEFSSLPKACTSLPKIPDLPDVIKQFALSKQQEVYSVIQNLFKLRGAQSACGYCSRKIRCRQRKGGEWKKGCRFMQVQMVDEQCQGTNACEIKPILGACPPPIPMPRPRRKPKSRDAELGDLNEQLQQNGLGELGDQNLEIEAGKNTSQGPPLWHCARNKDGSKCLCCCGWYFPDSKTGKCVSIRKDDSEDWDDQTWNWSGLTDLDLQAPFALDGVVAAEGLTEQIEAPPMDALPEESNNVDVGDGQGDLVDQMPAPAPDAQPEAIDATAHQVAAPITPTVDKRLLKKPAHEGNEI